MLWVLDQSADIPKIQKPLESGATEKNKHSWAESPLLWGSIGMVAGISASAAPTEMLGPLFIIATLCMARFFWLHLFAQRRTVLRIIAMLIATTTCAALLMSLRLYLISKIPKVATAEEIYQKFCAHSPWLCAKPELLVAKVVTPEPIFKPANRSPAPIQPCRDDLSACSDAVILDRALEISAGVSQVYQEYRIAANQAAKDYSNANSDIEREAVRFSLDARTDMLLQEYRVKYRENARRYRQEMERRIGPSVHDEGKMRYYDISDSQRRQEREKVFFDSNHQIDNIYEIAEDLQVTAQKLRDRTQ